MVLFVNSRVSIVRAETATAVVGGCCRVDRGRSAGYGIHIQFERIKIYAARLDAMNDVLAQLASERPIFYSEADLQHALAWELHAQNPTADIRLEYPANLNGNTAHIDILVRNGRSVTAIELKYKTAGTFIDQNGETYALRNQGAHDQGRYDFIKDIERLESFVAVNTRTNGCAIFIANDAGYWNLPRRPNTVDADFRIHDGRVLADSLSWSGNFKPGTVTGRTAPIVLRHTYTLQWHEYSGFDHVKHGRFRYLMVHVSSANAA